MAHCLAAAAQNLNPVTLTNVTPVTPEVGSLGKYIDMPVGYSTGVPEISIPLYTLKHRELEIPIGLSYNASGIKVEEGATWVGTGWNLNVGGSISRVVHGLPDDLGGSTSYMNTTKTAKYILSLPANNQERYELLYNQANFGFLDVEPDMYFFSVMGYSGQFYFDQELHDFVLAPYQNLKISCTRDANGEITGWRIVLPNGTSAYFGTSADVLRTGRERFLNQYDIQLTGGLASMPENQTHQSQHYSSWQLMDVVSLTNSNIKYYYDNSNAMDFGSGGETTDIKGASGCSEADGKRHASFYRMLSSKAILKKISTDLGDVFFIQSALQRADAIGAPLGSSKSLDSIIVKRKDGRLIKAISFSYDYYNSPAVNTPGLQVSDIANKRLRLNLVKDGDATYQLKYNTTPIVSRMSPQQDYWGYYNGKTANPGLTPSIETGNGAGNAGGADRTIDLAYAKAGILEKIIYPTGGSTEFTYESNVANTFTLNGLSEGYQYSGLKGQSYAFYKSSAYVQANPRIYIDSFTIADMKKPGMIFFQIPGYSGPYNTIKCPVRMVITGITKPSNNMMLSDLQTPFILQPGKYKITATIQPTIDFPNAEFAVTMSWLENPDLKNIIVGGLRVAKIINSDALGNKIAKSFKYTNFNDSTVSSGTLVNLPNHNPLIPCGDGGLPAVTRIISSSTAPLTTTDGQFIRYENVTEYYDENKSSFKSELTFSNDNLFLTIPNNTYPIPANTGRSWRSGLLLNKKIYEQKKDLSYGLLTEEQNYYRNYATNYKNTFGIKMTPNVIQSPVKTFSIQPGMFVTEWYLLDSTVTFNYSGGNTLKTKSENYYNSNYLLSNTRFSNSNGKTTDNKTWYPKDYSNVPGFNINTLIQAQAINIPIRKEISVNGKITGGQAIKYNAAAQPITMYQYENAALSDTVLHDINSIIGLNYNPKTEVTYTAQNNISTVKNSDGVTTVFLWGYMQSYPVAKIVNSDYTTVNSVITQAQIDNAIAAGDASLRILLNTLRTDSRLKDAQVTTYTHDPLVGITSSTDEKGQTTYYEYDEFQRLKNVKDQNGNILKNNVYHYKP
ncbi:MAG TPA: hypothetical protein VNZ46_12755 [Pedobacter sp.]|uniref:hypothetical protein n=1 Tax=Pedobacter sp. HMWF019 TaxID=2056856 RepID=UPI0013048FAE|nr:hypothetical protein [Pedobacter sp. HMWF019]HWW40182.1 hypothetical protein [Pedobacter sp.]